MVTRMLEKAIEIEGLLRIIRDGNPLPETYRLLHIKTKQLADEASGIEPQDNTAGPEGAHAHPVDFVMAAPAAEPTPTSEVVFANEKELPKEEPAIPVLEIRTNEQQEALANAEPESIATSEGDLELDEDDDIILTFDDSTNEDTEPDFTTASTDQDPEPSVEVSFPTENEASTAEPQNDLDFRMEQQEPAPANAPAPKAKAKLRSAFSLNDRFLYARELFNGNMKMFDSTIEFLEGIDDYSIIEEYFYNELGWDAEKPYVGQFMEIIHGRGTQL